MKLLVIVLLLFTLLSCKQNDGITRHQTIEKNVNDIYDSLVEIRRNLHKHPELSGKEKITSRVVAEYLTSLGLEVNTNIIKNGVVGILKGSEEGRKIAWRADMDAIKIEANDSVNFRSQNKGIAHMCGHDVHTAIGLGIANVLSSQKNNLKGTVYFIFQPAEETFTGAKEFIENGLFDIIDPDEIYGLHIGPGETGTVNTKANELFAYQKTIQVKLKPEANEEEVKDFLINILKNLVRDRSSVSPSSIDHFTDQNLGLESEGTIYKDYFILQYAEVKRENNLVYFNANIFETNKENIDLIPSIIKKQIINSKYKDQFISIEYSRDDSTVFNDPKLTLSAMKILESLYDNGLVKPIYGQVPYFNEDFMYYQQKVPGVLFFLGGSNIEKGLLSMPHSPNFGVDEETIKFGVKYFSSLILERTDGE